MTTDTAIEDSGLLLGEGWRDRIEPGVRGRICGFIEEIFGGSFDMRSLLRAAHDHIACGCGTVRRPWR
jgi:hypothetical protein